MTGSSTPAGRQPAIPEWWDVTDEYGHPTEQVYRRGDPDWPPGRFHVVAATCAHRNDGAVLLTQRAADKEFPLAWEFPGGSALSGESSRNAATRELHEETGLHVAAEVLTFVGRFTEASALFDLYTVPAMSSSALTLDPDEVAAAAWVSLWDVQKRLREGEMALPWTARLGKLWSPLVQTLETNFH